MKTGTKSVLFGVHQFILHPLLVAIAWIKLYHRFPTVKESICIFLHDIGYIGKEKMDDDQGDRHPELGAKIAEKLFGKKWENFILGHSRFYHHRFGIPISKLYYADKYFYTFLPWWLYLPFAYASGEIYEYMKLCADQKNTKYANTKRDMSVFNGPIEWYKMTQKLMRELAEGQYM